MAARQTFGTVYLTDNKKKLRKQGIPVFAASFYNEPLPPFGESRRFVTMDGDCVLLSGSYPWQLWKAS